MGPYVYLYRFCVPPLLAPYIPNQTIFSTFFPNFFDFMFFLLLRIDKQQWYINLGYIAGTLNKSSFNPLCNFINFVYIIPERFREVTFGFIISHEIYFQRFPLIIILLRFGYCYIALKNCGYVGVIKQSS